MVVKIFVILCCLFFIVGITHSQDNDKALLYRVDDGVFQLTEGETIDLTDRHLLLAFQQGKRCFEIVVNGRKTCIEVGERFDLTRKSLFRLGDLFSDKDSCFLDVVKLEDVKGADAIATFRLHCV